MAENLNENFSSVFTREEISARDYVRREMSDYLEQLIVNPKMIILYMKDNKSHGVDGIPPKLLLEIVEQFNIPFATVCALSLEEGVVLTMMQIDSNPR